MFILFECRAGTAMAAKVYQVNHCVTADFRLSFDYVSLNMMGFIGYSIFNIAFYFDPTVQEQYRYSSGALSDCHLLLLLHLSQHM